jgi:CheY-like chemotaxis protein
MPGAGYPRPRRAAPRRAASRRRRRRGLRILVADDNRDFADSLASLLTGMGHDVTVVYDGQAALDAARRAPPDVGLFDVGMPRLDGCRLAAAVRGLPGGRDALLIAITGWGQQADRRRALDAGFDHRQVKPIGPARLVDLLGGRVAAERVH